MHQKLEPCISTRRFGRSGGKAVDRTLEVLMREKGIWHRTQDFNHGCIAGSVENAISTFSVVEVVQGRPKRSFASFILKFCSQVQYPPGLHP